MRTSFVSLCCVLLCCAVPAKATTLNQGVPGVSLSALFPHAVFAPEIPTIATITGVQLGQRPLQPDEVVSYFRELANSSPLATLVEFGRSYEGRPLVFLAVSDEATIADLAGFKSRHASLLDSREKVVGSGTSPASTKAVAWMAYGIHGDELSSTDAAAALAYRLVAGSDAESVRLRTRLLVLIDPCENPDGRTRYLAQVTSFAHRQANPDLDDLSQKAVWPWGRGNHYLFDMNRDWFMMLLPESVRSREIARWLPELMVDSHEMGGNASYLFSPPRHPFNPHLPSNALKWDDLFGQDQAQALDGKGYPYYMGEWNEEFFPGYGSSWASYHGAVGILYEMSRTTGTLVHKRNGTVRTFGQAIDHQVTSSLANLKTLADHAPELIADHRAGRTEAVKKGKHGLVASWVFPPDRRHPERLGKFGRRLYEQGIEVLVLAADQRSGGLHDARTGQSEAVDLPAGTLMVPMAQPAGDLARVLLDPHVPMGATFLHEEREYLEKQKGSRLYDTTSWSVPLLRGVPAYWSGHTPSGDWQTWTPPGTVDQATIATLPEASYYIIDGDRDSAPAMIAMLLQKGVTVRVANKPFRSRGRDFLRGAVVLQREGNCADLTAIVAETASKYGVDVVPSGSADSSAGPDLGGGHFRVLTEPRVGVLTGMPVAPTDYGFVWHLLDQGLDLRFSAIDVGGFTRTDLSRYNVLVFPSVMGGTGLYRQILGKAGLESLRNWIRSGGTAIGISGGARLLADEKLGLTKTKFRNQVVQEYPSPVWSISARDVEASGRPTAVGIRLAKDESSEDKPAATDSRNSPYDVAPILGPGARPFAKDLPQGTPLGGQPISMDKWLASVLPAGQKTVSEADRSQVDRRLRRLMPQGVLLRADLDEEFWLNFGLPAAITVIYGGDDPLVAAPPVEVAARFADLERLHLGGLLWPEAAARLAETAYATREGVGRGQIILFADHPGFRRWPVETERMLANAIVLGPGLGARWSSPW